VLGTLFYYQPGLTTAKTDVLHVELIAPQESLSNALPRPQLQLVRKIHTAIAPRALDTPNEPAIVVPSAPVAPSEPAVTASAPSPPAASAPVVLPRFDAAYLQNPPPAYPALSRRYGEEGRVMLRVVVRPDGMAQSVELRASSGSTRLDESALEAVRKWRFVPARQGDTPVTAAVIVPIVFSLKG